MPRAKYESIYQELKAKVEDGTYPYGSLLPSENTLITLYDCSRNTIRRSLAGLIEDGHVQAIHGKGVQVIYRPAEQATFTIGGIESFQETAKRNHLRAVTKVVRFSEVIADDSLCRETGFEPGAELYYIQRVRYLDGKALIMDTNVFLKALIPGLTPEIAEKSIYEYIENTLGRQIITSKRMITVERATHTDWEHLDLGDYDCLAVITGQTFSSDGMMFEYTQSRHHPNYFCFQNIATRKRA